MIERHDAKEGTGRGRVWAINPKMNQGPGSETHISPLSLPLTSPPGTEGCGDRVGRVEARTAEDSQILALFSPFFRGPPPFYACK